MPRPRLQLPREEHLLNPCSPGIIVNPHGHEALIAFPAEIKRAKRIAWHHVPDPQRVYARRRPLLWPGKRRGSQRK